MALESSKPGSRLNEDDAIPPATVANGNQSDTGRTNVNISFGKKNALTDSSEVPYVNVAVVNDHEGSDDEGNDDEEDDELRKRVEEFIEKINRGWRKEKGL
ncbi:unnamed protein product [Ilex paraguariensis]|uniref:Uncharacterized protein n=1 Tax=Ilex paraguariensis TaxID=185542 RepID=A0ABC8SV22_9AQUA